MKRIITAAALISLLAFTSIGLHAASCFTYQKDVLQTQQEELQAIDQLEKFLQQLNTKLESTAIAQCTPSNVQNTPPAFPDTPHEELWNRLVEQKKALDALMNSTKEQQLDVLERIIDTPGLSPEELDALIKEALAQQAVPEQKPSIVDKSEVQDIITTAANEALNTLPCLEAAGAITATEEVKKALATILPELLEITIKRLEQNQAITTALGCPLGNENHKASCQKEKEPTQEIIEAVCNASESGKTPQELGKILTDALAQLNAEQAEQTLTEIGTILQQSGCACPEQKIEVTEEFM